jgi:hypothetical protein
MIIRMFSSAAEQVAVNYQVEVSESSASSERKINNSMIREVYVLFGIAERVI